jgi:uncharacterized membrane protein
MYTFAPLADIPVTHGGFEVICFILFIVLAIVLMNGADGFFETFFVCAVIAVASYGVSFHYMDQSTQTFANTQVQAEFVGYQPEVRLEKSGKSSYDNHYMYVIYRTNGNSVILQGRAGIEYPKNAILYKN